MKPLCQNPLELTGMALVAALARLQFALLLVVVAVVACRGLRGTNPKINATWCHRLCTMHHFCGGMIKSTTT